MSETNAGIAEAVERVASGAPSVSGLLCPRCNGGRSREHSVSVYPSAAAVKAKCHRASCTWWGAWASNSVGSWSPSYITPDPRPYLGALRACDWNLRNIFSTRYQLTEETIERCVRHAFEEPRLSVYLPVYPAYGKARGGVLRRLEYGKYKTENFVEDRTSPFIAWYGHVGYEAVVVVEDQLSAMRVMQLGRTGVALLGSSLSNDKWDEIKEHSERYKCPTIYLALDRDAFPKALDMARRFCPTTHVPVKVLLLDRDFKDCTDDEILAKLS